MLRHPLPLVALALAACGDTAAAPPPDGVISGSRLRARLLVSPDGPRQHLGFHDTTLDLDCAFWRNGADDELLCLPDIAGTDRYADPGCSIPLIATPSDDGCGEPPRFVGRPSAEPCRGGLTAVWRVGAVITPAQVYALDGDGACVSGPPDAATTYREVGAELPLSGFVAGVRRADATPGRLELERITGSDGSSVIAGTFDDVLGVSCSLWDLGRTGTERCVPAWIGSSEWADPSCAEPLASIDAACAGEVADHLLTFERVGCDFVHTLYQRGDEVTPDVLYRDGGDSCEPAAVSDTEVYFAAGPRVEPASLAATTRSLDEQAATRLAGYRHVGDDGVVMPAWGVHDTALGLDCGVQRLPDGRWRCVPYAGEIATLDRFDDPGCTVPVVVVEHAVDACDPDDAVDSHASGYPTGDDGCAATPRLFEVGARRAAPTYQQVPDGCVATGLADNVVVYDVAAELGADDWAAYTEVVE